MTVEPFKDGVLVVPVFSLCSSTASFSFLAVQAMTVTQSRHAQIYTDRLVLVQGEDGWSCIFLKHAYRFGPHCAAKTFTFIYIHAI